MAGYVDYSKSVNAVYAEREGLMTASRLAKQLGVPVATIRAAGADEWHHTSCHYNRTDYFNPERVAEWLATDEGRAALEAARAAKKTAAVEHNNCHVEWLEWAGSVRHPKAVERSADGAIVTVRGQTATITLAGGQTFQKRLTTTGFTFGQ